MSQMQQSISTTSIEALLGELVNFETPLAKRIASVGDITYIGNAPPGSLDANAVWQIKKLDESGSIDLIVTWADGDSDYDNVWDDGLGNDYTTLSYS